MKHLVITIGLLTIIPATVLAQTQSRQRLSPEPSKQNESATVRSRVVGPKASNHADSKKMRPEVNPDVTAAPRTESKASQPAWGNTAVVDRTQQTTPVVASSKNTSILADGMATPRSVVQPTMLSVNAPTANPSSGVVSSSAASVSPSTYLVGAGDVLDIRLPNTSARESTLFTVLKNGVIEYPLLTGPIAVAGMTTDEIARVLATNIKVIKTPRVNVTVRDYASHAIVISGLVDSPGKKILRRQAMPLYALLAQASVRPEAMSATIVHAGKEGAPLSLKDEQAMATMVFSGDSIRITGGNAATAQYIYVGGDVTTPGEKTFRSGMTLTQTLLSAGANVSNTKTAKIARRNPSGLLSTVEYDVNSIAQGKTPDPQIVPGDRIEVKRAK